MKTLLERAKPQLLEALEKLKETYPNLGASVEEHLIENFFISDLRWGTWVDLRSALLQTTKTYPDNPYEVFEGL